MASTKTVEISRLDLENLVVARPASITDVQHLSSYSWMEEKDPKIAVPGLPPLWKAPTGSQKLAQDSGFVYIAQNAARHPESPFEPLFRSLFITHPSFDIGSIDVISDRNNIRKLLQFVNPGRDSHQLEAFNINVEVTKNTALLGRVAAATSEFIRPGEFRGFGHEFEKKYTTAELHGASGHHRILSYRFCGMNFIIRHETDGYIKRAVASHAGTEDDALLDSLQSLSLAPKADVPHTTFAGSTLRAGDGGHVVPLDSTLEIKTRAVKRPLGFDEVAPQLWISQTPNLVRAYHDRRRFLEPKVEDISNMTKTWEAANQSDLGKLGAIVQQIVAVAKDFGGRATIQYDITKASLILRENESLAKMLPEDLYDKFGDTNGGGTEGKGEGPKVDSESPSHRHVIRDDLPFAAVIQSGIEKGFRQIFRNMPTNLGDYRVLCESLKASSVDVLQGRQVRDLMVDMRNGKEDWDPVDRCKIGGSKTAARDSAFRLLYTFLQDEVEDHNAAYNATLFVISHFRLFGFKIRTMVRQAFDSKFAPSDKQRKQLDLWPAGDGFQEDDATTEEEFCHDFYDSDWS